MPAPLFLFLGTVQFDHTSQIEQCHLVGGRGGFTPLQDASGYPLANLANTYI